MRCRSEERWGGPGKAIGPDAPALPGRACDDVRMYTPEIITEVDGTTMHHLFVEGFIVILSGPKMVLRVRFPVPSQMGSSSGTCSKSNAFGQKPEREGWRVKHPWRVFHAMHRTPTGHVFWWSLRARAILFGCPYYCSANHTSSLLDIWKSVVQQSFAVSFGPAAASDFS